MFLFTIDELDVILSYHSVEKGLALLYALKPLNDFVHVARVAKDVHSSVTV